MKRGAIVSLTIVLCLGHAALASGQLLQIPCTLAEFSLLPPNTGISLSRRIYDNALQYPVFGPAIVAARDAWNATNAAGRLGGWTGVIPDVNSPECPAGQTPFRISALNFQTEPCTTVDAHTHFDPNIPAAIAFVDYYTSTTLGVSCPQCGTKSMLLNLMYTFSLEPLPGQNPKQFDIQSIMAHEFGHMLGLGHMDEGLCGLRPFPPSCSGDPDRNTMSKIYDGETCERDLSQVDKDNANSLYPPPPRSARDFNGDFKTDILWRHDSGGTAMWLMNGLAVVGGGNLPWTDPSWKVGGIGDFNGDSRADILWRNDSGAAAIWLMDGVTQIAGANLSMTDPSWKVGGVGDFNGDGKADILWRNDSGANAIWLMDGLAELGGGNLPWTDPSWKVGGLGDFNGDGKADILWRNDSGATAIWLMDGLAQLGGANLRMTDPAWKVGGVGDFNSDGKADILWRHDSGANAIWFMNGLAELGGVNLPVSDPAWKVAVIGDFNGDRQPDILWRNTVSGDVPLWLMNGSSIVTSGIVGTVSLGWQIVPSR
jgi:VCBS repeat protein